MLSDIEFWKAPKKAPGSDWLYTNNAEQPRTQRLEIYRFLGIPSTVAAHR
jgi:hypothetical protein